MVAFIVSSANSFSTGFTCDLSGGGLFTNGKAGRGETEQADDRFLQIAPKIDATHTFPISNESPQARMEYAWFGRGGVFMTARLFFRAGL